MPDIELKPGQSWTHEFEFTTTQVAEFAQVTGDTNPVHLDPNYAAQTAFRTPVVHGMLGAAVFSRVFGTIFPGPGTLYLSQSLDFLLPIRTGKMYLARFSVLEEVGRKRFKIRTELLDADKDAVAIDGEAVIRIP